MSLSPKKKIDDMGVQNERKPSKIEPYKHPRWKERQEEQH
jgi:hypothetical protein